MIYVLDPEGVSRDYFCTSFADHPDNDGLYTIVCIAPVKICQERDAGCAFFGYRPVRDLRE
jgi:hypothetical protein